MRDLFQIFDERLALMRTLGTELNFRACSTNSNDLILASTMFEYKDGVFVGEVLEAIYEQIWRLVRDYILSDEDQISLKANFDKYLDLIANSYKKPDKNELYSALTGLRYEATKLQFKCAQTMKRKERREPFE